MDRSQNTGGPKDGLIDNKSIYLAIGMKCEGRYVGNETNQDPDFIGIVDNFTKPTRSSVTGIKLKTIYIKAPPENQATDLPVNKRRGTTVKKDLPSSNEVIVLAVDKSGSQWNNFTPHSSISGTFILNIATNQN